MTGRRDYYHDPAAPAANSLVPGGSALVVDDLGHVEMPEYLFRRTHGIVGLLRRLIEDGCTEAITSGEEQLTPQLLARTAIRLGNLADLDRDTGEVPEIPTDVEPPRRQKKSNRRPRNTVFDDRGAGQAADG